MNSSGETETTRIMEEIARIPMLSTAAIELLQLLKEGGDNLEIDDVRVVVEGDPGLCAKILSLANSALYSRGFEIATIGEALSRLGIRTLLRIGLEASLEGISEGGMDGYGMESDSLWQNALATSIAARSLAKKLGIKDGGALHATGLLHNFGRIAMNAAYGDRLSEIQLAEGESFADAERREFGMDCAEVSARLLEHWRLPARIVDPVRYLHNPMDAPAKSVSDAELIHVASHICHCGGWGAGRDGTAFIVCADALKDLNIQTELIDEVLCETMIEMENWRNEDELSHSDRG